MPLSNRDSNRSGGGGGPVRGGSTGVARRRNERRVGWGGEPAEAELEEDGIVFDEAAVRSRGAVDRRFGPEIDDDFAVVGGTGAPTVDAAPFELKEVAGGRAADFFCAFAPSKLIRPLLLKLDTVNAPAKPFDGCCNAVPRVFNPIGFGEELGLREMVEEEEDLLPVGVDELEGEGLGVELVTEAGGEMDEGGVGEGESLPMLLLLSG